MEEFRDFFLWNDNIRVIVWIIKNKPYKDIEIVKNQNLIISYLFNVNSKTEVYRDPNIYEVEHTQIFKEINHLYENNFKIEIYNFKYNRFWNWCIEFKIKYLSNIRKFV